MNIPVTIDQNALGDGWNIQINSVVVMDTNENNPMIRRSVALFALNIAEGLGMEIEIDADRGQAMSMTDHVMKAAKAIGLDKHLKVSVA